ncbi:MAG: 2,3-bisphosphoglycerate-independent phosphoglycerate mutase [Gammaproteobacteria bacterium]|nr:2,3-bisphosphoglycerate-independent phosphoglycerate mutase [Gammaproteobacteria bacterium]MDH5801427.1 2,3-bisphosphoglycerate-independent phosphoglycerate mutase [Gammaproteobacteria bacterium]
MADNGLAPRRPVVLLILDGFGVNPSRLNNAVAEAKTPKLDSYFSRYPVTLLQASGPAVGLPDGQMGNSEVGHLTIGCGDIIRQDLVAIDDAINDGSFYENPVLCQAVDKVCTSGGVVHLLGLVSNGGVHSHTKHLLALIDLCRRHGGKPVLHMITDGRDTGPTMALKFLAEVEPALQAAGGFIATVSGRYFTMDRDNRWERIELAWKAIAKAQGDRLDSAQQVIETAYEHGETDEFISPVVLPGAAPITDKDSVIFFNFRKDRARQMTAALYKPDFDNFDRGDYEPVEVVCMTQYDEWYRLPHAFQQDRPRTTLAEVVSRAGLAQFHCAETEKYAHVTYFLNGRHGDPYTGEVRTIIPSPQIATYDLEPQMSAAQVADAVIDAIYAGNYSFIAVNFANGDMVGHTGVRDAIISAVETLDREVGRVLQVAEQRGYSVVLTADHGNCEEMVDFHTGSPQTQHTVFPVPCMVMDEVHWSLSIGAGLSSVAPTVLHLMGLSKPDGMSGRSLLIKPLNNLP